MSELKVYDVDKMADVRSLSGQFYRKSEADKVIAEKDARIKDLEDFAEDACLERDDNQCAILELEDLLRHANYKRCMAMANFCFTKSLFLRYVLADRIQNGENYIHANDWRINLYEKWCERWKKLAEKLKEGQ